MKQINHAMRYASALTLALALTVGAHAADPNTPPAGTSAQPAEPMSGKQKATAIGATTGAVAGAVVGGPVGAVAGAVVGGVVGHEGTDANGKVTSTDSSNKVASGNQDTTVRSAQAALNDKGYNVGSVDGQWGPNTQSAVRQFQADRGLTQSGTLDSSTLAALGVNR
jgi:murein L,D-transpeptidase YcbB/YkuD